jgi:hypothetical protein
MNKNELSQIIDKRFAEHVAAYDNPSTMYNKFIAGFGDEQITEAAVQAYFLSEAMEFSKNLICSVLSDVLPLDD